MAFTKLYLYTIIFFSPSESSIKLTEECAKASTKERHLCLCREQTKRNMRVRNRMTVVYYKA